MEIVQNPELESSYTQDFIERCLLQMATAARTAPKTKGIDTIITVIVMGETLGKIADEMDKIADERGPKWRFFSRDADNLRQSHGCLLIGVNSPTGMRLECGACGIKCRETENKIEKDFRGPICHFKTLDLGIAIGSAVRTAQNLCLDNRIQYTVGLAARRLNYISADIVMGIPVSITGKNIYFDRE